MANNRLLIVYEDGHTEDITNGLKSYRYDVKLMPPGSVEALCAMLDCNTERDELRKRCSGMRQALEHIKEAAGIETTVMYRQPQAMDVLHAIIAIAKRGLSC